MAHSAPEARPSAHWQTGPELGRVLKAWVFIAATLLALGLPACEAAPAPKTSRLVGGAAPIRVVVTIPPLRGLVEPLLTDSRLPHKLTTLVPPGASEHGFEISPDKLGALGKADVVVMAGLGMEPQVEKFLADHPSASRRVVNIGRALKLEEDTGHDHDGHDHGADGHAHDHDDPDHHHAADPHTWLDPVLAKVAMTAVVAALRPGLSEQQWNALIDARGGLSARITEVQNRYEAALGAAPRRTIVVAHDAYGYLAKRYNLEVIAITGLNAGEPRPGDLKRAADAVREHSLTTIFVEPQLPSGAAERLAAATGAKVAILDPLGDGDWFKLMDANLAALKDALGVKDLDPADRASTPASSAPEKKPR